MSDLKPCPFCAGEAKMIVGSVAFVDHEVHCDQCGMTDPSFGAITDDPEAHADAVSHWNTRAPDPRVQALVDALRVACDALRSLEDRHNTAVWLFHDATEWAEETRPDGQSLNEFVFGPVNEAEATARAALKAWEDGE